MKKFGVLVAPFLSMGVALLCADGYNELAIEEQAVVVQENKPEPAQLSAPKSNNRGMILTQEVTPEAKPKVTHWADPFITAEFVYWRAAEENLDYAYTGTTFASGVDASKGSFHMPHFEFEPGFKFGFGLRFKHDGWDLYTNWTWLNEFKAKDRAETGENSIAHSRYNTAGLEGVLADITAEEFKARWKMQFNAFDVELGRNFYISRFLTLRPHFGLKFGWIDQSFHIRVEDAFAFSSDLFPDSFSVIAPTNGSAKMDQNFFGVGIRAGLDTVWYFAKHWGLYGDFAFSSLWSDFHTKREDHISQTVIFNQSGLTESFPETRVLDVHRILIVETEVLEMGLGLRYDTTFFAGDYEFYVQAGWEKQIWFNQNQLLDTVDTKTGNLSLQGLNVKVGLMF